MLPAVRPTRSAPEGPVSLALQGGRDDARAKMSEKQTNPTGGPPGEPHRESATVTPPPGPLLVNFNQECMLASTTTLMAQ